MFEISLTPRAANHIRAYRKFEQRIILDAIEGQLAYEPTVETRNRKRLGENDFSSWELRVEKYRVFYDVVTEGDVRTVEVKAVGHKERNTLYIDEREVQL